MDVYGTEDGFSQWLAGQGLTLPDDANPTVLMQIGTDYVDAAYGYMLTCSSKTGGFSQELEWPRTGHTMGGQSVPKDLIPTAWVKASYRAAYLHATNPGWATGTTNPDRITRREKVDVIEREFFAASDSKTTDVAAGMQADATINGLVLPWLCSTNRTLDSLFMVI